MKQLAWGVVVAAFIGLGLAPAFARPQLVPSAIATPATTPIVQVTPLSEALPNACLPIEQLQGRDTILAYLPCSSLDMLPVGFRLAVECTLDRLRRGGWDPMVFETWRSVQRQAFLYSYGRTRPGPRVTNASSAFTGVHHYRLAIDIVHRTRLWNHPRFFYWLGQHAEACGLVAGAFWTRFPDPPHLQFGAWDGAPPLWARTLIAMSADSVFVIHRRVGALN